MMVTSDRDSHSFLQCGFPLLLLLASLLVPATSARAQQSGDGPQRPARKKAIKQRLLAARPAAALKQAELLVRLPIYANTPDGMCLYPDGNIILSVPNINDQSFPAFLMKITPDDRAELFYPCPLHPDTGKAYPFGICVGPGGDLFYADLQWFADPANPNYKSRVVRIPMKDGKPGKPVTVVSGMVVANAVVVRDGFLYVSDTMMVPGSKPLISGVYRIPLSKEGLELKRPLEQEPHLIATIKSYNEEVGFGADGLTFDSKGNMYIGNFADGTVHKVAFDADGEPQPATIFARADFMKSCDGIFCDTKTDIIYVADSIANAVQMVYPDGSVKTLAQDPENDGTGGRLDQPCEVLIRDNEIIVSNFDFPVPGGVNTRYEAPNTVCRIPLD
jgi:sugar lactone lactonase YvrE